MNQDKTRRMVLSALFMALCMVLPFLTGQIPQIGSALSPMHIPVFLCGFVCGWQYGAVVGLIAPLLRGTVFGMPPLFPTGIAMAFELAAYGMISGWLYRKLPPRRWSLYVSLIAAMLVGRVLWGIVRLLLAGLGGSPFTWALFIGGAFTQATPGIICHIVLIPLIVLALKRANLLKDYPLDK